MLFFMAGHLGDGCAVGCRKYFSGCPPMQLASPLAPAVPNSAAALSQNESQVEPPSTSGMRRGESLKASARRSSEANGVPNGVEELGRARDVMLSPGWRRYRRRWQESDNF